MNRARKSLSSAKTAQSTPTVQLSRSEDIKSWKVMPMKRIFGKTVILKVVGRSPVILTPTSCLIRYFLENDDMAVRLVVWNDEIDKMTKYLRLGNIVRLVNLQVRSFFQDDQDEGQTKLWRDGEFHLTKDSSAFVVTEGKHEYIDSNFFSPYWYDLAQVEKSDKMIAFRAKILTAVQNKASFKINGKDEIVAKLLIGTKDGRSANCFINVDYDQESEVELLKEYTKNTEVILLFGEPVKDEKSLAIYVNCPEYVFPTEQSTLQNVTQFSSIDFDKIPTSRSELKQSHSSAKKARAIF